MADPIDVSAVPGAGLDPALVEQAAEDLERVAGTFRIGGLAVVQVWSGLRESYRAPEPETDPLRDATE